jgi:hypothetical protein
MTVKTRFAKAKVPTHIVVSPFLLVPLSLFIGARDETRLGSNWDIRRQLRNNFLRRESPGILQSFPCYHGYATSVSRRASDEPSRATRQPSHAIALSHLIPCSSSHRSGVILLRERPMGFVASVSRGPTTTERRTCLDPTSRHRVSCLVNERQSARYRSSKAPKVYTMRST